MRVWVPHTCQHLVVVNRLTFVQVGRSVVGTQVLTITYRRILAPASFLESINSDDVSHMEQVEVHSGNQEPVSSMSFHL